MPYAKDTNTIIIASLYYTYRYRCTIEMKFRTRCVINSFVFLILVVFCVVTVKIKTKANWFYYTHAVQFENLKI